MNEAMMPFTVDVKKQQTSLFSFHNILNHVPCYGFAPPVWFNTPNYLLRSLFSFCSCRWSCKNNWLFQHGNARCHWAQFGQKSFRVHFESFRGLLRHVLDIFTDWDERIEVEITIYTENPANHISDIWTAIRAVYFQHVRWCLPPMWR